ncbi:MAG: 30S ribosomal protein S7 [Candidatus Dormibacteraeota bacterium]|nr:30S ribosomal protein S7 [Candidatus Dormibacteraeota bacterium]MBV9525637.1 30S ribosomal protein S7 [Candidatus Dormibacteraeota bacterium]
MPRRARVQRRTILPDPIYANVGVAKFVNCLMLRGKKSVAEGIVYSAFERIRRSSRSREPLDIFEQAMRNVTPILEVKPKRVGGATYQVPVEIRHDRRQALARRWIIRYARARSGRSMSDKLAAELMDAANGMGASVKRKEDTHKMAESNKAFSHFRY